VAIGVFLVLLIWSQSAAGADRLEIPSSRDTAYLPLVLDPVRMIDMGARSKPILRPLQVMNPCLGDSGIGNFIQSYNPPLYADNPSIFSLYQFPSLRLVDDDPVRMTISDWAIYDDVIHGAGTVIAAGFRHDSAFAVRLLPGRDTLAWLFLATGRDATGDGRWETETPIVHLDDYDHDGRHEAFIYVNPGRDRIPRVLCCVELETLRLEWSLPIASLVQKGEVCTGPDSSILFVTYNPKQGVADDVFSDNFGYLVRVDHGGAVIFERIIAVEHSTTSIIPGERAGAFYILHEVLPAAPPTTESILPGLRRLSRIDGEGRVLRSITTPDRPLDFWRMEYGDDTALFVRFHTGVIRVYDSTLSLLAESAPSSCGLYLGRVRLKDVSHPALVLSDGIYSARFDKLVCFPRGADYFQIVATDQSGNAVELAIGGNQWSMLSRIYPKPWLQLVSIFYMHHETWVLMVLSGLLVGLIVVNYYRRRTSADLRLIAAQKRELETIHAQLNATLTALPDLLIEVDAAGKIYLFHAPRPGMQHVVVTEFAGRTIAELFPSDAARIIMEAVGQAAAAGHYAGARYPIDTPAGICWYELSIAAKSDLQAPERRYILLARDITQRTLAEKALRESEQRYRSTIDSMADIIHVVDRDLRLVLANKAFYQWHQRLGLQTGGVGDLLFDVYPFLPDSVKKEYQDVFESGRPLITEEKTPIGDALYITETHKIPIIDNSHVSRVITIVRDITERKAVETALRESQETAHALLNATTEMAMLIDTAGIVLETNAAAAVRLGNKPQELVGKHVYDLFPPKARMERMRRVDEAIRTARPVRYVDDTWDLVFDACIYPILGPTGAVERLAIFANDITDRKRAEEALRESEIRYRTLMANVPVGIFRSTAEGKVLSINNALVRMFGYDSAEEAQSISTYSAFVVPSRRSEMLNLLRLNGSVSGFEAEARRKDGSTCWLSISARAIGDEKGGIAYMDGVAEDITERKMAQEALLRAHDELEQRVVERTADLTQANLQIRCEMAERQRVEDALRASETHYRTLLETANSLILCLDKNACITVFNDECERVTGYKRDEVLGKSWPDIFLPPDHYHHRITDFAAWVREHPADRHEGPLITKSGEIRTILWSNSALFSENDDELIAIAVGHDITERKRSEGALIASEARFQQALAHSRDMLYRLDLQTRTYDYISSSVVDITGYTSGEIIAMGVDGARSLTHPEDLARLGNHREKLIASLPTEPSSCTTEYRMRCRDGAYRWLSDSHALVRDPDGQPRFIIGSVRDITEQKKAEEALRASEERFRELAELLPEAIYETDLQGKITFANRAAYEKFDYTPADMAGGVDMLDTLVPEDRRPAMTKALRILRGEVLGSSEYTGLTRNGRRFPVIIHSAAVFREGKAIGLRGLIVDITERKLAEQALRLSEEKYRLLIENVPVAIGLYARDGEIRFVNENGAKIFKRPVEDVIGRRIHDLLPAQTADQFMIYIERVLAAEQGFALERQTLIDDEWIWFDTNFQPVRDSEGRPSLALVMAFDITARKLAEARVQAANQEKYQQAKDIAGGVAHEIHNALCPASNALDKLKERLTLTDPEDRERNVQLLHLCEASVMRAAGMTQLVKTYTRLDAEAAVEDINLGTLFDEIFFENQLRLTDLAVELVRHIPPDLSLPCDHTHAYCLFNNLIINALDAVAEVPARVISVAAVRDGNMIRVDLADSGPGIPPSIQPRIFDMFFSTKPSTGTGLGLAMVKKIADLYQARVQLDSQMDKGAKFTILWPAKQPSAE